MASASDLFRRATPLLAGAWAALGVFLLWDGWQTQVELEMVLGGVALVMALGNVVMRRRIGVVP